MFCQAKDMDPDSAYSFTRDIYCALQRPTAGVSGATVCTATDGSWVVDMLPKAFPDAGVSGVKKIASNPLKVEAFVVGPGAGRTVPPWIAM